MPGLPLERQGLWGSLKARVQVFRRHDPWLLRANGVCMVALFVGAGLMIAGMWIWQCR